MLVDVADKPTGLVELFESFVPLSHELKKIILKKNQIRYGFT